MSRAGFSSNDRDVRVCNHYGASVLYWISFSCSHTIPLVIRFMFSDPPSVPVLYLLLTIGSSSHSPRSASLTHHPYTVTSRPSLQPIIVASVLFEDRLVSPLLRDDPFRCFSFIEPGIFASVCRHNSLFVYGRSLRTSTLNWFATVMHISTEVSFIG